MKSHPVRFFHAYVVGTLMSVLIAVGLLQLDQGARADLRMTAGPSTPDFSAAHRFLTKA